MAQKLTLELLRSQYRDQILASARTHDLQNIRVIGSVARGEAREESDLDLLVSRVPGGDAWGIGGFYEDMQALVGRKVDIAMEGGLDAEMRARILSDAVPL